VASQEAGWPVTHCMYPPQVVSQEAMCTCLSLGASSSWDASLRIGQQSSVPFTAIALPDRCKTYSFMSPQPPGRRMQGAPKPPTPQVAVYLHPVHVAPTHFFYCFIIHMCIQHLGHSCPHPLPLLPPPSIPGRNYFAFISNFVEERV
jgi:hypothetical protein